MMCTCTAHAQTCGPRHHKERQKERRREEVRLVACTACASHARGRSRPPRPALPPCERPRCASRVRLRACVPLPLCAAGESEILVSLPLEAMGSHLLFVPGLLATQGRAPLGEQRCRAPPRRASCPACTQGPSQAAHSASCTASFSRQGSNKHTAHLALPASFRAGHVLSIASRGRGRRASLLR